MQYLGKLRLHINFIHYKLLVPTESGATKGNVHYAVSVSNCRSSTTSKDTDKNPIYATLDLPGVCKRGLVEVRCRPTLDNGFPILGHTWRFD